MGDPVVGDIQRLQHRPRVQRYELKMQNLLE